MADSGSAPDGSASFVDDYETLISTTDVELLKIAWRNEKAAPEILPYEAALIHRIKEQIELAIEKYIFHIVKTDEYFSRLSKLEQAFAKRCTDDMGAHLKETVLSKLPDNYQSELKQSTTSEEDDMDFSYCLLYLTVPAPRLDSFVICKAKQFLSGLDFEPEYSTEITEMEPDLLTFVCYKFIKKPFENGKIDLV
ncbi:DNA replication complex GINS protein SLD5 [Linum perenne]